MFEYLAESFKTLFSLRLLWELIIFNVLYVLTLKVWSSNSGWTLKTANYKGKQRVHDGEIPRLGGLIIYFCLIIHYFILHNDYYAFEMQVTLACLIPTMLVTTKEDLSHDVDYKIRILALLLSSFALIIYANQGLPVVNHIIVVSDFFKSPEFSFAFFTLCLITLANGCNFIDGMNGLLGFFILGVLVCCLQLSYIVQDTFIVKPIMLYSTIIIFFLLVNFPWGKLFMGDSGAFLLALLTGIWVINFFGIYTHISSWNAGLIFFYPIAEVIFSIIRKLYQNKSPFYPDREHLHLKIFDILNTAMNRPKLSNNLTTIFLAIFWLTPPFILPLVYDSQVLIVLSILLLSLIYLLLNIVIPAKKQY
jgi:UDP-GlcNAc:undecaprenyl-phosphate GlcNAc-1-phosphate transferase